jgi:hypothetical protein
MFLTPSQITDGETGELARLDGSLSSLELLARKADEEGNHSENR